MATETDLRSDFDDDGLRCIAWGEREDRQVREVFVAALNLRR